MTWEENELHRVFQKHAHRVCNLGEITQADLDDATANFSKGFPTHHLSLPLKVRYMIEGDEFLAFAYESSPDEITIFSGFEKEFGQFRIAPVVAVVDEKGWRVEMPKGYEKILTDDFAISVVMPVQLAMRKGEGSWVAEGEITWN